MVRTRMLLITTMLLAMLTSPAWAQVLSGAWVKRANKRIDANRKTAVRVLVLDASGQPVAGARVHIQELRHAFAIGFTADGGMWPGVDMSQLVWRCFTAVSLSPVTGWDQLQPSAKDKPHSRQVLDELKAAQRERLKVRWGAMVSTDMGREPAWVGLLKDKKMRQASETYMRWVLEHFGRRISGFDLLTDTVDHPAAQRGFDLPALRSLFQRMKVIQPAATLSMRYKNALLGAGLHAAFEQVVTMQQAFVPLQAVTLGEHFRGRVLQLRLAAALHQWDQVGLPLTLDPLTVGGEDPATARINLEVVLRTCFADPHVTGIYMSAVTPDESGDVNAQLLTKDDKPTAMGKLFDRMFHHLWWTNVTKKADNLGDVRTRVFAGAYLISATLPNSKQAKARVWIGKQNQRQLIVVQAQGK